MLFESEAQEKLKSTTVHKIYEELQWESLIFLSSILLFSNDENMDGSM